MEQSQHVCADVRPNFLQCSDHVRQKEETFISVPILRSKLYIPPLRPHFVARPRLVERLTRGLEQGGKLTLISAPAGFGKSTLLAD